MITQETLKEFVSYDHITGDLVWIKSPAKRIAIGNKIISTGKKGYIRLTLKGHYLLGHRVCWFYMFGVWPDQIDHINGIRNDNRLVNLRDVKAADNAKNKKKPINNKSGVVGVRWVHQHNRWAAQIHNNGKSKALGYFKDKQSAINARSKAEKELGYHENHGR